MFLTTAPFTLRDIVDPASPVEAGRESAQEGSMAENEHPKGALLFVLVFLVLVVLFWINTYMRLWLRY